MVITPVYDVNDPAPAINAKVPIRVEMEYQGKTLSFTATDALPAWDDNPEHAREAAKELLRAMLREVW
jgi:hypothetical protein